MKEKKIKNSHLNLQLTDRTKKFDKVLFLEALSNNASDEYDEN